MIKYINISSEFKFSAYYNLSEYLETPDQDILIDNVKEYKEY